MDFTGLDLQPHVVFPLWDEGRLFVAILALFLSIFTGVLLRLSKFSSIPPVWVLFDYVLGGVGDRLYRVERRYEDLFFRGFLITVVGLFLAFVLLKLSDLMLVLGPYQGYVEIIVVSLFLSVGSIALLLNQLYGVLNEKKTIDGVYYALAQGARINLSRADDYSMARAAIGLSAMLLKGALVAPIFWYVLAGLPGLFVYGTLAALAWRFGKDGFSRGFGMMPLWLERLLGVVPMVIAACIITVASLPTATMKTGRTLSCWTKRRGCAPYFEGGLVLSVFAWSLNVSLGGPVRDLGGGTIKKCWVGPEKASAKVGPHHLKRVLLTLLVSYAVCILTLLVIYSQFLKI